MWLGKSSSILFAGKVAESQSFNFQTLRLRSVKSHILCLTLNSEFLFMLALSDLRSLYKSCTFIRKTGNLHTN